ncbi:hypothetical protein M011DRAFT_474979 [Sporormia fimetaria CBS 119925]|uniref:Zn(2)-C6 fungal-type domain-containing protein n=1 Tax=Sporormia fimetaria CBS 119925 TaxID=1340428 RepID=A0A6A6VJ98_9PLEO|nr:hypothetical protein M011DRAFT_474979 [Sporormia fimetaria CBS 119925]
MPKEQVDLTLRKKMRKGTHSCFECRRRKIRCIFPPENPSICSECFARGSRCIDQEHANPDIVVDHRKNLRERVSRLEALVDSLLEDKAERSPSSSPSKTPSLVHRESLPLTPHSAETSSSRAINAPANPPRPTSDRGHHIPILSVFEDALNEGDRMNKARIQSGNPMSQPDCPFGGASSTERLTLTCHNIDDMMGDNKPNLQAKRERARQGLLAMLPSNEQLQRIFESKNGWWQTWRRKCSGTSAPDETLAEYATKALRDGNIGAIGIVVLSVGISTADEDEIEKYIDAVDRFVMSDDEHAASLEGMECLVLKAKWYADVGQPRKAWICNRKGLMYAQLMGLHRQRTTSAAHESIWWSMYHGDRFLSLLLGLPYCIQDSHCDLTLPITGGGKYLDPLSFFNKVAIVAGKVIDRNQSVAEQSFAWALQLDQELEDLWKQLDPDWLEYSHLLADYETNAVELRERLMGQITYHQTRVYLHLPFMLKSSTNPRFCFSRNACVKGSREALKLYQALRPGNVQPLYECKAIDFIGFTAAVLVMLGLFNFGGSSGSMERKEQEEDSRLIETSIDIFRRASCEKGGKVALQSAEVLDGMLKRFKAAWGDAPGVASGECSGASEFVIPYFGTISIRRGKQKEAAPPIPASKAYTKPALFTSTTQAGATGHSSNTSLVTPSSETTGSDLFSQNLSSSSNTISTPASSTGGPFFADPFVSYDGFYNWPASHTDTAALNPSGSLGVGGAGGGHGSAFGGSQMNDDSMANFPLPTNNFSWQNMPMDIDQDWSWFLNDGSGGVGAPLGVAGQQQQGQQPVGDQFAQQMFAGFG